MESGTGTEDPVALRAFEAAYAMFRVAHGAVSEPLAESLERAAVRIIESAAQASYEKLRKGIEGSRYLLHLGENMNAIHAANVETILRALDDLVLAVESVPASQPQFVHLEDILSGEDDQDVGRPEGRPTSDVGRADTMTKIRQSREANALLPSEERQSVILRKIRQTGNCRLRDIQEILPDVSERTIRYDMEYLIGHGLVERFGPGGPATYYREKEALKAS